MNSSNSKPTVAVLGTGTMGAPIARNLQKAGYPVTAWNRTEAKARSLADDGVSIASNPAAAVAGAHIVLTVLKDADSVLDVLSECSGSLAAGTVLVQISTVGAQGLAQISDLADDRGLRLVDAPVQGTKGPAENAQLMVLAAAPAEERAIVEPLFDAIGKSTLWVSEVPGDASKLKVAVNSFISALTHGVAEAVRLTEAFGLRPETLKDALQGGPLASPFSGIKLEAILQREFAASFTVDNAVKDSQLVVEAAEAAGLWLPLAQAGLERYRAASAGGHGGDDMAASYFADPEAQVTRL